MKLFILILILTIVLISGCTQNSIPAAKMLYVCSNGTIVNDSKLCYSNETKIQVNETQVLYVPSEDILKQTEKAIFDIANEKRTELGIKELVWNGVIANLSRAKSKDMADRDYFDHPSPDGETFEDILNKNKIFYLTGSENIARFPNITSDQELLNSSLSVVEGWLNSPGHRANLLNKEVFSDDGVGVYCKNKACYFTMEFVDVETKTNVTLHNNYGSFIYIYDPTLTFNYNVSVLIEVNSTKLTDTYIVEDKGSYDNFISGHPITSVSKFLHNNYVNITILSQKGYGILLYSDPNWVFSDADITVKIRYLNSL